MKISSLRSGDGLSTPHVALCDGRTSARFDNQSGGFDRLVHYAPDSWDTLARVLQCEGHAATWRIDGQSFRFDWVEVFPFGFSNCEERADGVLTSQCIVEQGVIAWHFEGVRESLELKIPRAMFCELDNRERGVVLEKTAWALSGVVENGAWRALRDEAWLLRDSNTFAGIEGKAIVSQAGASQLHLCARASTPLAIETGAAEIVLTMKAQSGAANFALGLGSSQNEADERAQSVCENFDGVLARQGARYGSVADQTPNFDFGKHRALGRFSRIAPGYLESLRVADEPAAFRANNDYHWVWGWDMTRPAFGFLVTNQTERVRDLLSFRGRFRNADGRSINQYDNTLRRDLRHSEDCDWLEINLAHDYLAWTGDDAGLQSATGWLRGELERAFEKADPHTGLMTQAAASTDFPEEFGRTFPAWLAYPTGWQYNALCGAEKLFARWGDEEFASHLRNWAAKVRRNFVPVFWNESTGFWNEGVHPTDRDLKCDIPLSTALAMMDGCYGEDLLGDKFKNSARYAAHHFLREDGVHITSRGETRGWKEWTRQTNNWFAANDTMLARLFRAAGDAPSLEKLFALYEINFAANPCGFEGKPFERPLETSSSWQAFGASAWQRNLVETAAGLQAHLGGLTLVPCGLREPVTLRGLKFRQSTLDFSSCGLGRWPSSIFFDKKSLEGTLQLPVPAPGHHALRVEYSTAAPSHPILLMAADAEVLEVEIAGDALRAKIKGNGYTPLSFYAPSRPTLRVNGETIACHWDEYSGRGAARALLRGAMELGILLQD